jgi:hypothetical protein
MDLPMTKITPALFTATLLALGLAGAPAQALSFRTFVSAQGSDANACTLSAPCRTFAAALAQTSPGGIIDVLDPAGYGALTINKSVTIIGRDWASILVTSGNAITVTAGASDVISLRGLIIDGAGTANFGIILSAGGTLNVQNSVIRRFAFEGILLSPTASSNKLFVSSTLISDNGGSAIVVSPAGSGINVTASLNRVELLNNTFHGVLAAGSNSMGPLNVTVADSAAANNGLVGFYAFSAAGQSPTAIMLERCVAVNNGTGLQAENPNATVRSSESTITGNATGWQAVAGGTVFTYGDNNVDGNTAGEGAQTPLATR